MIVYIHICKYECMYKCMYVRMYVCIACMHADAFENKSFNLAGEDKFVTSMCSNLWTSVYYNNRIGWSDIGISWLAKNLSFSHVGF